MGVYLCGCIFVAAGGGRGRAVDVCRGCIFVRMFVRVCVLVCIHECVRVYVRVCVRAYQGVRTYGIWSRMMLRE